MKIQITLHQIKQHSPCIDGWKKVLSANGGANADMHKPFPVSSILDSNNLEDTLWVLRCLPDHDHLWRKFACWCALSNIELIKPYCSTDDYELIIKYLNTCDENLRVATLPAEKEKQSSKLRDILDLGKWTEQW